MTRWLVAALPLLAGCASLDSSGPWLLPPLDLPPTEERAPLETSVAALRPVSLSAPPTFAEGTLTLDRVLSSVETSFPLLSAVRQEQVLADAKLLSSMGYFDFELNAGASWSALGFYENNTASLGATQQTGLWGLKVRGGYRLGAGDFDPTFDGKRVTNHGGEFHMGLSLPLLQGGSIDAARRNLRTATLGREVAADTVGARRLEFLREASLAYWSWVAAGQRLQVAEGLLALAERRQQGVELKVQRGDLPQLEAIDNRRLVVRRRATRIAARRGLEKTAIALSLFLRNDEQQPIRPDPSALPEAFPTPIAPRRAGLPADLERALRYRPELSMMQAQREQLGVDLEYAENTLLPQLNVFVLGSQDLDGSNPSQTKGEFELTAGVEFGFPVQNRRARGQVLASQAKIEQLNDEQRYVRDAIEAEVRDALSALQAAYEGYEQAITAADLAGQVSRAEQRRFELGDSDVLRLNLREVAAAEADLGVIRARLAYWNAVATYRAAVGGE